MEPSAAEPSATAPVVEAVASSSSAAAGNDANGSPTPPRKARWIRITIAAIKAVLCLELAAIVLGPLAGASSNSKQGPVSDEDSGSDLDPADVLMDYLTGRTGLTALQLLRKDQLRQAVDNLITEDFEELGVSDRGADIRKVVEDIIEAREKGVPPTPVHREQRVGLGRLGPLKYNSSKALARNAKADKAKPVDAAAESAADAAPATQAPLDSKQDVAKEPTTGDDAGNKQQ